MNHEIYRYILAGVLSVIAAIMLFSIREKPEPMVEPEPVDEIVEETVEILIEEEIPVVEEVKIRYDVPLDEDLQDFIIEAAGQHGIDPAIVLGMIQRETEFDPELIGDSGKSFGLMQIQKRWHEDRMERLGVWDLMNPYQNVAVGIDYLAELLEKYDGDLEMALIGYNSGPTGAYEDYFSNGIYSNSYSQTVVANTEKIREGMSDHVLQ